MNTSENRETVLNKSYSAYVKNRDDLEMFKSLNERVIAIFKDFSKAFYPMREYDERYQQYFDILRDKDKSEQGIDLRSITRAKFRELLNEHGLSKNDCHIYFHKHLSDEEHQTAVEQINYIYNYFLKSVLRDISLGYFYDKLSRNNRFCLNISPRNYSGIQPLYVFDQTMNLSFCGKMHNYSITIVDIKEIEECVGHAYLNGATLYHFEKLELDISLDKRYVRDLPINHSQEKQRYLSHFLFEIEE